MTTFHALQCRQMMSWPQAAWVTAWAPVSPISQVSPSTDLTLMWRSQGRELRSRAAETAELQEELGPASLSALQKSYSLSVSFAQVGPSWQTSHMQQCRKWSICNAEQLVGIHLLMRNVLCVQILSVTVADEEVTVSYCHNVASQHQNELHFTLAMPSPEVCRCFDLHPA
jgi:hypothetical protein